MLRQEFPAYGPKDPARGDQKSRGSAEQPALAASVSRANSNFEGKDACRGHEHRARRRESLAPTGISPSRFGRRSASHTAPLGEPSNWMNDGQRVAWERFRCEVPWLMESDRALVEIASYLRARVMTAEEVGVGALNQLRMCMAQMGATPADRSKVAVPDEPERRPNRPLLQLIEPRPTPMLQQRAGNPGQGKCREGIRKFGPAREQPALAVSLHKA